jgi:hypothetical protein
MARLTCWSSCLGAGVLAASLVIVGEPGLSAACACGGVVSNDSNARVAGEEALVTTDGHTETMVMRLDLRSSADDAALVVPTPTPAKVGLSSGTRFSDLAGYSAPVTETRRHWSVDLSHLWRHLGLGGFSARSAAPSESAQAPGTPSVLDQVELGPLEATTLAGGDVAGVQQWLGSHGYTMRPEVVARLDPYLKQGWAFVAMRLTGPTPLNGQLPPVKFVFGSDQLIYPMRMSAAARSEQDVVIYTLGPHRMQRVDPDTTRQGVVVDYAGSIASWLPTPQVLTEFPGNGAFLTRLSVQINDPGAITSDFAFTPAPNDDRYQKVSYIDEDEDITVPVLILGYLVAVAVAVLVVIVLSRRRKSAVR